MIHGEYDYTKEDKEKQEDPGQVISSFQFLSERLPKFRIQASIHGVDFKSFLGPNAYSAGRIALAMVAGIHYNSPGLKQGKSFYCIHLKFSVIHTEWTLCFGFVCRTHGKSQREAVYQFMEEEKMTSLSAKRMEQTEPVPPVFRVIGMEMNETGRELTFPERSRLITSARTILLDESQAISTLADQIGEEFVHAVELILDCKGNVIITGMGKAGHIARKISATMSSTGTPSCFLHPAEAFHGDLGMLGPSDLVMILSHSGETEEVCRLLPSLAEMKLPTIAITGKSDSRLGQFAQVTLALGQVSETGILGLAPSTSTTLMLALGDALALSASEIRGFRAEDFARFHPGGSLGRKLSHVEEYMRPISQCRVAPQSKTIREIFVESHVPGRRSGAILLVDAQGRLTGIFTDSDLAKLFELREDQFIDSPVESVMTCHPKFIRSGSFMTEAVAMMGEKKISELPVLDENDIPVGMLDITDLVSFLPENK